VRELCERLGVPLTVERVDVVARQAAEREGLEEAARELRYGVFWGLMAAGKADVVATAHTLDDQAETVMMKLLRGAWTEGIGGIAPVVGQGPAPRAQGPVTANTHGGGAGSTVGNVAGLSVLLRDREPLNPDLSVGRIVRPMLGVRRAEVEAYLTARGQAWRQDATNRDTTLTRNRVRHELMPVLRSFNPGVDSALARLAEIARDEEAFWRAEVARMLPQLVLPGKPVRGGGRAVSTAVGERSCAIEIERLRPLAGALRRRLIRAAARSLGCRVSAEETARLLALAGLGTPAAGVSGRVGAKLELAHGLRAERTARELQLWVASDALVGKENPRKTPEPGAVGE
ncbi:MAG TPA: tRNA lysidine(34) synthetase, partial [Acidobacteriaceae bacterium]|nr:tRNA lysidine(34) synthetase [Acidobacteriaceae bacterium]